MFKFSDEFKEPTDENIKALQYILKSCRRELSKLKKHRCSEEDCKDTISDIVDIETAIASMKIEKSKQKNALN